jgi:putative hydrolase of the HAD superfamily
LQAVIFDLGRVLIDYNHAETIAAVAAISSVDRAQIRALYNEIASASGTGEIEAEELHQFFIDRAQVSADPLLFQRAFCSSLARIEPALAYALELQQRPGVTVGVISNTNAAHVAWLDEHVPELDELDLVMMSNEIGMEKPDPAVFELALELLDVPAQQAFFVDDIAENVQTAQRLGMAGLVHTDWAVTRAAIEAWLAGDNP